MRAFTLVRKVDVSGISGCGSVAEGVVFHDNQVVLSWFGQYHSIEVHPSIESVMTIHGHHGSTIVEWVDQKGNPSCHRCGEPIEIGQDIEIYCKSCGNHVNM